MQRRQLYRERTAEAKNTIHDIVVVARASPDPAFRRIQMASASGVLHDWIETTDHLGDASQSYTADRGRLVALIDTTMLGPDVRSESTTIIKK